MKRSMLPVAGALAAVSLALAACGQGADMPREGADEVGSAEAAGSVADIVAANPEAVRIALENDYVRVLRFDLEPEASLPPHEGGRRVIYAVTDYEIEWTEAGMEATQRSWKRGDVHPHEAGIHSVRNGGTTTASFVVFERLEAPLPAAEDQAETASLPTGTRSLLEEPGIEVLEVELQPGDAQEMHPGGWRSIYALTDYTIEWREGDEVSERMWSAGDAHWHEPGPHAASNVGDTAARWIVVTFER